MVQPAGSRLVTEAAIADPASPAGEAVDARVALKVKVTDGGNAAGVGTGGPTRPNVQIGGAINGTTIQTDQIHGVILQPGGPGFNNIIGGDGTSTVNTATPNVASAVGNCGVSLIGGYDNVAGSISSKIIADHCYTEVGGDGHNAIYGGADHIMRTSAAFSAAVGGSGSRVAGRHSLTTGLNNVNSGTSSFVSGESNTLAGSTGSVVSGSLNTVNSSWSQVGGYQNTTDAAALMADVSGANGRARSPFVTVKSSGRISVDGDAQQVAAHYRGQTTSTTAVLLVAAYTGTGGSSQYLMVQGQSVLVTVEVVARIVGGATVGAWSFRGVAQWQTGAATPVWLGGSAPTATVIYTDGSAAAPSLLLGAGGSAGRLFVSCAGVAATTINWSCKFEATEVMA